MLLHQSILFILSWPLHNGVYTMAIGGLYSVICLLLSVTIYQLLFVCYYLSVPTLCLQIQTHMLGGEIVYLYCVMLLVHRHILGMVYVVCVCVCTADVMNQRIPALG